MKGGIVVFLQNAWSPLYANGTWPRPSWLRALWDCRTGKNLLVAFPGADSDPAIWVDNTTETVAPVPSGTGSVVPPDPDHIRAVLRRRAPRVVVACGLQAERAVLPLWPGPLVVIPHPAYRLNTRALLIRAGAVAREPEPGRVKITPTREGTVDIRMIPPSEEKSSGFFLQYS
jgi:hypothetical protein